MPMLTSTRPLDADRLTQASLERLFLLPTQWVLLTLVGVPFAIVVVYSLLTRGAYGGAGLPFTTEAYSRAFDPLYGRILLRSVLLAASATALCLLLAFPLAFYIARYARHQALWLNLVTLPFWTSLLIRIYAWMFLLRDTGLINAALLRSGMLREPLPMLYNEGAVVLGLVYSYLPAMVLPLYASLQHLDATLLDAAEDLGATPLGAAWRVAVPLAHPGVAAGCALVFIPALGAYLIPDLLGGGQSLMLGNLVANQFGSGRDWPFGAAVSVCFTLLSIGGALVLFRRRSELL